MVVIRLVDELTLYVCLWFVNAVSGDYEKIRSIRKEKTMSNLHVHTNKSFELLSPRSKKGLYEVNNMKPKMRGDILGVVKIFLFYYYRANTHMVSISPDSIMVLMFHVCYYSEFYNDELDLPLIFWDFCWYQKALILQ